jgi:hypothetical protein
MKKIIILMCVLLWSDLAMAEDFGTCGDNRGCYCSNVGVVYNTAAHARNTGASPELAFQMVSAFKNIVSDEVRKKAINQVFFDSSFFYAGGKALQMQMYNICMGNVKTYKPLK